MEGGARARGLGKGGHTYTGRGRREAARVEVAREEEKEEGCMERRIGEGGGSGGEGLL